MTPITRLLQKASEALPPQRPSRSSWAPFYGVVDRLINNGHNVTSAVNWLVDEKAIPEEKKANAYRALLAIHQRKSKNA